MKRSFPRPREDAWANLVLQAIADHQRRVIWENYSHAEAKQAVQILMAVGAELQQQQRPIDDAMLLLQVHKLPLRACSVSGGEPDAEHVGLIAKARSWISSRVRRALSLCLTTCGLRSTSALGSPRRPGGSWRGRPTVHDA